MTEWHVRIGVEGDTGDMPIAPNSAGVASAVDLLDSHFEGSFTFETDEPRYTLSLDLQADTVHDAVSHALDLWRQVATKSGLPLWNPVKVEALTVPELERELSKPLLPELVGTSEIAELLDVSKQRVSQLWREHAKFPAPLKQLECGPVWDRQWLLTFIDEWERKSGRPRKDATNRSEESTIDG